MQTQELRAAIGLLPILVAVAEEESVTTAAAVLRMPQPSVSRGLARLGTLLGSPVVQRQGRGVVLTPTGRALLPFARDALASMETGLATVAPDSTVGTGVVSLAFQTVLGEVVVPTLIRRFRERHPHARFELTQGSRAKCLEALTSGHASMAIVATAPALPHTRVIHLYEEPLVVAVSRDHPLANAKRVRMEQLAHQPLILLKHGYGLRTRIQELFADTGIDLHAEFEVEDARTARGLAAAGLGVTLLPASMGGPVDQVVDLPLDHPLAKRRISAVVKDDANATVHAFASLIGTRSGQ